jgi:3-hydroxyanthranilate 3,4-dioxygenase
MAISKPFNLTKWIDENRQLLKPPVGNKNLYTDSGDYIVMVVAGPNARKDFHYNETEELFYQLEGSITIITQENGERNVLELHAGDMYLHLQSTPFPITFRGFNRLGY